MATPRLPSELIFMTASLLPSLSDVVSLSLVCKYFCKLLSPQSVFMSNSNSHVFFGLFATRTVHVSRSSILGTDVNVTYEILEGEPRPTLRREYKLGNGGSIPHNVPRDQQIVDFHMQQIIMSIVKTRGWLKSYIQYRGTLRNGLECTYFEPRPRPQEQRSQHSSSLSKDSQETASDEELARILQAQFDAEQNQAFSQQQHQDQAHYEQYQEEPPQLSDKKEWVKGACITCTKYCFPTSNSRISVPESFHCYDKTRTDTPTLIKFDGKGNVTFRRWTRDFKSYFETYQIIDSQPITMPRSRTWSERDQVICVEVFHTNGVLIRRSKWLTNEERQKLTLDEYRNTLLCQYFYEMPAHQNDWTEDGIPTYEKTLLGVDTILQKKYFPSGILQSSSTYKVRGPGRLDKQGLCEVWDDQGRLKSRNNYNVDTLHGWQEEYAETGDLKTVTWFQHGTQIEVSEEKRKAAERVRKEKERRDDQQGKPEQTADAVKPKEEEKPTTKPKSFFRNLFFF